MSRRPPNPAAERAAKNQATIKSLLKLEANKVCADCKRNKHPRWASWNLGVFICIRCSGIHRGMGTHISRVKSVDLDSWTDEQLQSILSWGNARANKYWEAKLAAGHSPSEAKIENFIRTKYELKRWVMDGPMPDPSTLDVEEDDNIPLSIVKEKQNLERRESVRKGSVGQTAAPRSIAAPQADLIGGDPVPPRASTAGPICTNIPPKAAPAPPKATSTKDSLLGLDFLGTEPAVPPRPASTTGTPGSGEQSRPDLKQSILSLYATAPRPQPQPSAVSQTPTGSFGGLPSPTGPGQPQSSFGGLNDAFSSLSFSSQPIASAVPAAASPPHDAFSNLASISSRSSPKPTSSAFPGLGGGSFFDSKPEATPAVTHPSKPSIGSSGSFGGFTSPISTTSAPKPTTQSSSAALGDLFDFSSPSPAPQPPKPTISSPPLSSANSVFNLSSNQSKSTPAAPAGATPLPAVAPSTLSNVDVWGGSVWGAPEVKKEPEIAKPPAGVTNDFGWGAAGSSALSNQPIVPGASGGFAPKVSADEEFGGWASSTGAPSGGGSNNGKPSGSFGASEDLFSNVWQ